MMSPEVGSTAPDFTLRDQNNQDVTLASFRGERAVLLVFYPFAFSGICTQELCSVRDDLPAFQNESVQVLPISVDHPFALKAWSTEQGYDFPLLADFWPHGAVARNYGVFDAERGFALRGTYLIDRDGVVRFREVNGPGDPRRQQGWKAAVADL